jgi:predicted acetyltransferase
VTTTLQLVVPAIDYLPAYRAALGRGWSPDNLRLEVARIEQLGRIAADPQAFVVSLVDRDARGGPITLPDGTLVPRLPSYRLWMWDGEFCGSIGFRWQRGTSALPVYTPGHIGYAVVPWKRQLGYATQALRLMLVEARKEQGLKHVELTTEPDNLPSQRVILANGGKLIERFHNPAHHGYSESLRFRIEL